MPAVLQFTSFDWRLVNWGGNVVKWGNRLHRDVNLQDVNPREVNLQDVISRDVNLREKNVSIRVFSSPLQLLLHHISGVFQR